MQKITYLKTQVWKSYPTNALKQKWPSRDDMASFLYIEKSYEILVRFAKIPYLCQQKIINQQSNETSISFSFDGSSTLRLQ